MSLKAENTNLQERVEWLEQQLASERAAREEAQRDRETWRQACAQVEARSACSAREEARHDRDLLDKQWRSASDVANRNAQEAERAEADNAAMMERCTCPAVIAMVGHPGAALLEERQTLREHEADMAESLRNALERLRALESRLTMASAELRHAYKVKQDWELVARAIRILESVTTPGAADTTAEYVRALERVRDLIGPWSDPLRRSARTVEFGENLTRELRDACAKADALRGKA